MITGLRQLLMYCRNSQISRRGRPSRTPSSGGSGPPPGAPRGSGGLERRACCGSASAGSRTCQRSPRTRPEDKSTGRGSPRRGSPGWGGKGDTRVFLNDAIKKLQGVCQWTNSEKSCNYTMNGGD